MPIAMSCAQKQVDFIRGWSQLFPNSFLAEGLRVSAEVKCRDVPWLEQVSPRIESSRYLVRMCAARIVNGTQRIFIVTPSSKRRCPQPAQRRSPLPVGLLTTGFNVQYFSESQLLFVVTSD